MCNTYTLLNRASRSDGTSSDFALVRKAGSFQKGAWAIAEEEDVSKPLSMK